MEAPPTTNCGCPNNTLYVAMAIDRHDWDQLLAAFASVCDRQQWSFIHTIPRYNTSKYRFCGGQTIYCGWRWQLMDTTIGHLDWRHYQTSAFVKNNHRYTTPRYTIGLGYSPLWKHLQQPTLGCQIICCEWRWVLIDIIGYLLLAALACVGGRQQWP